MHFTKATTLLPEPNKDIFFYDDEAGFAAGYLDDSGRFICRNDGFEYDKVTLWTYAVISEDGAKLDVPSILNDGLIKISVLADRIYPGIKGAQQKLDNKIRGRIGQRLTEKDIELIESYLREYFRM